ncbi:nicotinate-nucleotide--dimethylbenzimidazole phosphoribosyltransferase [Larsenimonas rhizosphaerae]|uniref:nicotinate-nucleotide--dimethylbenzimidazole phosphoribosyltransferase n=1 Tax=Larsenimonas rhizosphaerae TaxID=2944682 RepID=UPI0020347613|nr:nicotinate-nucleotide--dimethylbenzimidazole phosphoribosyltransferase [Larsenimonas rhizosphaerae]MCM2130487.1 nicotinate-nucleotide--dimethylbenzimidazole phosphoribosyltransferase [Larsenimonas rhizosphaerae]
MPFTISLPSDAHDALIQARIDSKTKPPGALGMLERLALQAARALGPEQPRVERPRLLVFAGDHGVSDEGVSIAPSIVTTQMVSNFLAGGASVNVFARQAGLPVTVVDCGIRVPVEDERIINHRLGAGTAAIHLAPAMSEAAMQEGLANSRRLIGTLKAEGTNVIALGEMGIANTTASSALLAALTGAPVSDCTGRGTGIDAPTLLRKKAVICQALQRHQTALDQPETLLATLGGFEIVGLVGAILAAAEAGMLVLIDGFIVTVAAAVACAMVPQARAWLIFSHCSDERGHRLALDWLEAEPLLSLGLRIGEGSGAALALPLLHAALAFYNDMATFEQAGVTV